MIEMLFTWSNMSAHQSWGNFGLVQVDDHAVTEHRIVQFDLHGLDTGRHVEGDLPAHGIAGIDVV
jgi:hypothetical protein